MEESESYPRSAVFGRTETPEAGRSPRLVGDQLGEFRVPARRITGRREDRTGPEQLTRPGLLGLLRPSHSDWMMFARGLLERSRLRPRRDEAPGPGGPATRADATRIGVTLRIESVPN